VAQTTVIWCGDPRSSDSSPTQSLAVSRVPTAFRPPCVQESFSLLNHGHVTRGSGGAVSLLAFVASAGEQQMHAEASRGKAFLICQPRQDWRGEDTPPPCPESMRCTVSWPWESGSGVRGEGLGCRVQGSRLRVQGLGFRV